MLLYLIKSLKDNEFVKKLNKYLYSNWFIITAVCLMLFSFLFGLEIITYYIIAAIGLIISLFSYDMIPTIPLFMVGYMTVSIDNSPITNLESVLLSDSFKIHIIIIASIICSYLITRLVFELIHNKKKRMPRFLIGILLLFVAFAIGGLGSSHYTFRSTLYGSLVVASFLLLYLYLYYTCKKENFRLDYFAYVLMYIGIGLVVEVLAMYVHALVEHDNFTRAHLIVGWGVYNNVAGVLCMCLPAPLYLALKKNKGYIYLIIMGLLYIFTLLTQSRNGMVMSTVLYLSSITISLIHADKKNKNSRIIVYASTILLILSLLTFNREFIFNLFNDIIEIGFEDNGRLGLYKGGFSAFLERPLLGTGFYDFQHSKSVYFDPTSFLAPRYHNTIVQVLASTGIVGFVAYSYHRVDTIRIIFRNLTLERGILALSLCGLLLTSLLDCHFFNFGPGLHYGCMLFMLEMIYIKQDLKEEVIY